MTIKQTIFTFFVSLWTTGLLASVQVCEQAFDKSFMAFDKAYNTSPISQTEIELEFNELYKKNENVKKVFDKIFGAESYYNKEVKTFSDLPYLANDFYRAGTTGKKMAEFFETLSPEFKKSYIEAFKILNNESYVKSYIQELYKETYIWIKKRIEKGLSLDMKDAFERGKLSDKAIAVTIIRRLKSRGDTNFTKITARNAYGKYIKTGKHKVDKAVATNKNAAFRFAVGKGPFIDRFFEGSFSGHGAYAHLIQRDMIHHVLVREIKDPNLFYEFLGTKKGINFWVDLFDSSDSVNAGLTCPEYLSEMIQAQIL